MESIFDKPSSDTDKFAVTNFTSIPTQLVIPAHRLHKEASSDGTIQSSIDQLTRLRQLIAAKQAEGYKNVADILRWGQLTGQAVFCDLINRRFVSFRGDIQKALDLADSFIDTCTVGAKSHLTWDAYHEHLLTVKKEQLIKLLEDTAANNLRAKMELAAKIDG